LFALGHSDGRHEYLKDSGVSGDGKTMVWNSEPRDIDDVDEDIGGEFLFWFFERSTI
jgi:hypothetical protein